MPVARTYSDLRLSGMASKVTTIMSIAFMANTIFAIKTIIVIKTIILIDIINAIKGVSAIITVFRVIDSPVMTLHPPKYLHKIDRPANYVF